jgi:integrase
MIGDGVPLKVFEVLGHFSVTVTGDIYAHVSPDVSAQAMDALGAALEG